MAVKDRDRFSTATRLRLLGEQTAARVYRSQTKRQARRSRLTGRAALLALVLCSLVVALAYPMRQYVSQRAEIADQRAANGEQAARAGRAAARPEGALAGRRVRRAADPRAAALCDAGRDRLHRDRPGRRRSSRVPTQGAADRPWYANVWDGVDKADRRRPREPATPSDTRNREPTETRRHGNAPAPTTPRTEPTDADVEAFKQQLGRPPRGLRAIAHRCPCGQPDVVETAPRLPDGTPFPTTYYLTCPRAASAIGTLEANGVMKEMTERLATDPELAAAYRAAHEDYIARRDAIEVLEGFPSAGGMPDRVKCLHVLVGHSLAAGPGVNPLGDEAIAMLPEWWAQGAVRDPVPEAPVAAPAEPAERPEEDEK